MAEAIDVAPGVRVPPSAIEMRAVRASGPGGQNVNKVSSRVELTVELAGIEGFDTDARERLERLARRRVADGRLRVTAQESRDRLRNVESAREKVRELLQRALEAPTPRRRTRPRAAARARRLEEKHRHAEVKGTRRRVVGEKE
ncbi:MAG TPA: alternative ribosome rescue aminoacyl-tRNA hydrolase ArfB [Thermoanaerobaculia bacterium]|nr:alternative ribosome rescue aminoacyl-tRNA hydrolase ArfB [Thermoanaerobaculia bacterium]